MQALIISLFALISHLGAKKAGSGISAARLVRRIAGAVLLMAGLLYAFCGLCLLSMRWVNPPITMVQIQKGIRGRHSQYVPLRKISVDLQHAVIAAEDGRFYQHHGFDWVEMHKVIDEDMKRGKLGRGGSTITQQLVKNLFLTTERSLIKKAIEASLVPLAEAFLSKNRILELYLNVIEWGPKVYGAQAAAEYYYHLPASQVGREQAARMAAIIPAPLRRKPSWMNDYSAEILWRMEKMGW